MLLSLDTNILPKVRFIGYIEYKEPWIHFYRIIDEYILYIIESGELYIKEDDKEYILKQGDCFLLQPNRPHVGFKKSRCNYYYVHFKHSGILETNSNNNDTLIEKMLSKRKLSLTSNIILEKTFTDPISYIPKHCNISNKILLLNIFNLFKDAISDYQKKYEDCKTIASCKLQEILIKICREYVSMYIAKPQTHLSKVLVTAQHIIDYINENYHQKITSQDIQDMFELNYDYLNRAFHKITGCSIFNYLNMVRINKAKELIETTPLKVSEIGYLIGIDNPYYFSRLFKKYVGIPPSKYMEKIYTQSQQ